MTKAGHDRHRWVWRTVGVLLVLYGANWFFTPLFVSETTLESAFRPKGKLRFDPTKWREKPSRPWGVRYEMVDDLLTRFLRPGMTLREVIDLLGQPDLASEWPVGSGELDVHYNLGSQRDYPARSVLFPGRLANLELWVLDLRFRGERLYKVRVKPS
jgi:hypothetical protein